MSKKVLGVDFDDVLVKSGDALAKFHNARYGTSYRNDDVTTYDISALWQCTPDEARRRVDEFVGTEFHREAEAVFGAYDALKRLNEAYDIVIVTGRREAEHRDATIEWLTRNFLGLYRELHFTSHDDPDPEKRRLKSSVVKELRISAFIDDALPFAADVAGLGIPVFLFDTPWNRGRTPQGVVRVHSWDEVVPKLLP